ncbi:hypothetical protein GE061_006462 [Apolygus lucorum]|uniref:Peptidase S1 domain-containing protein n=1 Tax=Apolygus lucorum TaxID=248454 RepID=A0A6A4J1T4_APOLU|nr:hypothetical protein GE061_006462 [Apolygus lucorum]
MILLTISPEIECALNLTKRAAPTITDTYDVPWFCLVTYLTEIVCHCTIIHVRYVVVSVDSLDQPRPSSTQQYFETPNYLTVFAGTKEKQVYNEDFYQTRKGVHLYVGNSSYAKHPLVDHVVKDPVSLKYFVQDLYGIALNTGLLEVDDKFVWTAFVLPAPLYDWSLNDNQRIEQIEEFRNKLEKNATGQAPCTVATYEPRTRALYLSKAVYIPAGFCRLAYCSFDIKACTKFPIRKYHLCFKTFGLIDMCPLERGAAMYCESFGNRVVGFLTTALNCGRRNLPSVYTSLEFVHRLYKSLTNKDLENGPKKGDFKVPCSYLSPSQC